VRLIRAGTGSVQVGGLLELGGRGCGGFWDNEEDGPGEILCAGPGQLELPADGGEVVAVTRVVGMATSALITSS
jgi:hypothetical protein